jgi:hypothetical protein
MKKIKWTGLTPVSNVFGSWFPGEIKLIPDEVNLDKRFKEIKDEIIEKKNYRKRRYRENISDKMERDNFDLGGYENDGSKR